ncbi:hypothetical protein HPB50_009613 [Hyalomma asiaticum]|uniref:Uncharacterized protein n=1 Tax=Hyalomma asiaticum TaxID=266040 RepID=A0ACB7SRL8_HYAAI|nr:hypothetical protein HPB50_009613 [Hyalomma asiaticum]
MGVGSSVGRGRSGAAGAEGRGGSCWSPGSRGASPRSGGEASAAPGGFRDEEGIIFDIWLGAESVANICTDVAVILLLRKAEVSQGLDVDAARMTRVLGAFIAWNTVALLLCCGGNLAGLRFPPKWLYYTSKLYDFYTSYKKKTAKLDEEALVEALVTGKTETSRGSGGRQSSESTSPRRKKTADNRFADASAKSRTRRGRPQAQPRNSGNFGTTIIPNGSRNTSDRSRGRSLGSEFHTSSTGTVKGGKSRWGKKRKQLISSKAARTIDDAATIGKPSAVHSRQHSNAVNGTESVRRGSDRRTSAAISDGSAAPENASSGMPSSRPKSASGGASVQRPLASIGKSRRQPGTSAFANAQLLAKILARRKGAPGASAPGPTGASKASASSVTAGSGGHPTSDVSQTKVNAPRQPVGGVKEPHAASAASPVRNSPGEVPKEPLPASEAVPASRRSGASAADHSSDKAD